MGQPERTRPNALRSAFIVTHILWRTPWLTAEDEGASRSVWRHPNVVAALIGGLFTLAAAVLPRWL
ncbi:hypothetical protein GCM10010478_39860 [Streptomyces erythrogriseus]|uniref:Adenosylcobinamide-GDP ribazoletransferase n=1 Tax=Streptomyces erythrogriseus TaxID=284027 RepID=A0ABP6JJF6_9ACTN